MPYSSSDASGNGARRAHVWAWAGEIPHPTTTSAVATSTRHLIRSFIRPPSRPLEPQVLVGRIGNEVQRIVRSVGQPWPDAAELTVVHHGHEHHPIDGELLDLAEHGLAAGHISLASLLLEEIVDIGVAAIGIAPFRVD